MAVGTVALLHSRAMGRLPGHHTFLSKHFPKSGVCDECGAAKRTEYALIKGRDVLPKPGGLPRTMQTLPQPLRRDRRQPVAWRHRRPGSRQGKRLLAAAAAAVPFHGTVSMPDGSSTCGDIAALRYK